MTNSLLFSLECGNGSVEGFFPWQYVNMILTVSEKKIPKILNSL